MRTCPSDRPTADATEEALGESTHLEIDASLAEPGMIDDVSVEGETVTVDVAIPMPPIPEAIETMLARRVTEGTASLGADADVEFVLEDPQTRSRFFELERLPSGLDSTRRSLTPRRPRSDGRGKSPRICSSAPYNGPYVRERRRRHGGPIA